MKEEKEKLKILSSLVLLLIAIAMVSGCYREIATAKVVAPNPVLKKGARVAIVGDSITEQKIYSRYIECYLLACVPELELKVFQLGWSGEKAKGFAERMENDLMFLKPDVVTLCYGMNDGEYRQFNRIIGDLYRNSMKDIVRRLKKAGIAVVVGSPGAVDTYYFNRRSADQPNYFSGDKYNQTLAHLRYIAANIAKESDAPFANVHDAMIDAMEKAKKYLGEEFDVCGVDGVHPNADGHLVMAYAFLKAMGLDGNIGTITVDLKGDATATEGHRIISFEDGKLELESTRYPFCFYGDEEQSNSTKSILPFVPFNRELNRLTLVVNNLGAEKGRVTWGNQTKTFSSRELEQGINLAAEFLDNPFSGAFARLDQLVANKQSIETMMFKQVVSSFGQLQRAIDKDKELEAAFKIFRDKLYAKHDTLCGNVRAAVVPVRHTIVVTPVKDRE